MKIKKLAILASMLLILCMANAQNRMRVVIDNDFAGDPDGLFALAQLMESHSVDVRAVVGSHLHAGENWTAKGKPSATTAADNARRLFDVMGRTDKNLIVEGSNGPLADTIHPIHTVATERIIAEAMQCTAKAPLYVLCGGGLTEIASAWIERPEIADRVVVVWIGGAEYPGFTPPPGVRGGEYNTTIDIKAVQVVFNRSNLKLWQIPRNAYRQCLVSRAMLRSRIEGASPVAAWLADMLDAYIGPDKRSECYVLGDSPLVLVTALQSNWECDACSSTYTMRLCPTVDNSGHYHFGGKGRMVKVFDRIDTYLMFEDMFAKFRRKE